MKNKILFVALFFLALASCRKEDVKQPYNPETAKTLGNGFYLLNEGAMGSNASRLDFYNFAENFYQSNIFGLRNPDGDKLGDTGNDMKVYGGKLYVVMNGSNKVLVLDAKTAKLVSQLNIVSPRYVAFYKSKVYVTSYSTAKFGGDPMKGFVGVIDTVDFHGGNIAAPTAIIEVGRQPEGLAVVDGMLYVANSGGYSPNNYEKTISVIDLASNKVAGSIEVAVNLGRLQADKNGNLWVNSMGSWPTVPSSLYVVNPKTKTILKHFNYPTEGRFTLYNNEMYFVSYTSDWINKKISNMVFGAVDINSLELVKDKKVVDDNSVKALVTPYSIAVNPANGEVYVSDSKWNEAVGGIFCFGVGGSLKWKKDVGQFPKSIAFVNE